MSRVCRVCLMLLGAVGLFAARAAAQFPPPGGTLFACVRVDADSDEGRLMRLVIASEPCRPKETRISWSAVGPTGPQGPAGPSGAAGPVGPAGAKGSTGATGPQGAQGVAGPQGPSGATGPAGPAGFTGPQGTAGPTGAAGPIGPTGPAGSSLDNLFGTTVGVAHAANGQTCTLGQILLTASPALTAGGVPASGQLVLINDNIALFSLLGTTYGGDGTTTFALPDLRSITPNKMTYSICDQGIFPSGR